MKDRRGFLKLLGIGAGAVAAGVLAVVAGAPPAPAPRTIQDIERPVKPYIGPDSVPGGDYIKERPKVVPDHINVPDLTPDQHRWIVDGESILTFNLTPQPQLIDFEVNYDPVEVVRTTGTYDHNLGGYSLENTWTDYPVTADDAFSS